MHGRSRAMPPSWIGDYGSPCHDLSGHEATMSHLPVVHNPRWKQRRLFRMRIFVSFVVIVPVRQDCSSTLVDNSDLGGTRGAADLIEGGLMVAVVQ